MSVGKLLSSIIILGENGADISRLIRKDKHLLSLLVQEKTGEEKNVRFVQDFKTLVDVLVQQVIKYHLELLFSDLRGNILGEECDSFKAGDVSITVRVEETQDKTRQVLNKVLHDDVAADILSQHVHMQIDTKPVDSEMSSLHHLTLPDNLAVWIDPIDSTAEYIHGSEDDDGQEISLSGVRCVTVLIGVFNKETGEPVLGLVNQPFYRRDKDSGWSGRYVYGVSLDQVNDSSPSLSSSQLSNSKMILISSSEREEVKQCLERAGYQVVQAAGAGNKGLAVITGEACAYVLSKGSTYPWDICAIHAVLNSLGGGVVNFTTKQPLRYSKEPKANSGGLIAYRHPDTLDHLTSVLNNISVSLSES